MPDNRTWVLRNRPVGEIRDSDLELVTLPLGELAEGAVRVRTIYLSLDPTNRIWSTPGWVSHCPPHRDGR